MLSSKRIYRSLVDSRLLVTVDQAVLTIVSAANTFPYKARLYIEMVRTKDNSICYNDFTEYNYCCFEIGQQTIAEYGEPNQYPASTRYNIDGPNIYASSTPATFMNIYNSWCYIKPITKAMGDKIYELGYEISNSLKSTEKYLKMNSLDFYRALLTETQLIKDSTELALKYISKKQYEPTKYTKKTWESYKGNYTNPAIDEIIDNKITSQILTFPPTDEINLSSLTSVDEKAQEDTIQPASVTLHSIFNLYQQRKLKIQWDSEFGQRIQFMQDKLGIYLFCYDQILSNALLKQTKFPMPLIRIICEYTENDYNRILRVKTPSQADEGKVGDKSNRCIVM